MNLTETLEFIHSTDWKGSRLGLERMEELMGQLGNPQNELRFIHVAGTNGKGSVCAMLSSILTAAGYRTGMYTSPHLVQVNERIKINGVDITDEDLNVLAEKVKPAADAMEDRPTEFEILTAMAFLYFQERRCGIVVLEVGLGGRLDATNIIRAPEVAVICNIGLEHTEVLGDTLEKIAAEKAGIIKPGTSVVLYEQSKEVEGVVAEKCLSCGVPLRITNGAQETLLSARLDGQVLNYRERKNLRLSLLGTYQYHNAAVALETVDALISREYTIPQEAVASGLATVNWPGRFEILCRTPLVLVDGAHNPNGAKALIQCLKSYLPKKKFIFLMGVMADKNYPDMIVETSPYAASYVTVTPDNPRALPASELKSSIESAFTGKVMQADTVEKGLQFALNCGESVCAFGSLYMVGKIREYSEQLADNKKNTKEKSNGRL